MSKRKLLVFFFCFLFLFSTIIISFALFFVKSKGFVGQGKWSFLKQEKVLGPLTRREITKGILNCLDGMRDEEGTYVSGKECLATNQCKIVSKSGRSGLSVLWGRTKYIEATGDENQKAILADDIDHYLNNVKVISPDFWSKRLLYQMWQSKIFSENEKQKIASLAHKAGVGESVLVNQAMVEVRDLGYQSPDWSMVEGAIKDSTNQLTESLVNNLAFASDFLSDYSWTSDRISFLIAENVLYKTLESYFANREKFPIGNTCMVGLTLNDFYRQTNQSYYLDLMTRLLEGVNFKDTCLLRRSCSTSDFDLLICAMFSDAFGKTVQDPKYLEDREMLLQELIETSIDTSRGLGGFTNDGCVFDITTKNRLRRVAINGLMVGFLSENGL